MKEHVEKNRIVISEGKIGLVQVVMGLIASAVGFGPTIGMLKEDLLGAITTSPFFLPFGIVGLSLLFWRSGAWIDLEKKELVTWSGLIGAYKETKTPLSSFEKLIFEKVRRKRTAYPISLFADPAVTGIRYTPTALFANGTTNKVRLLCYKDHVAGEKRATFLAEALGLPLEKSF